MANRTPEWRSGITDRGTLEDLFHGLFEAASDAIIISDTTGTIVLVNAEAETLFGYTRSELIGQTIELLIPERFHDHHVVHRSGYIKEPRARMMGTGLDLYARRRDGSEFPVDISLSAVQSDDGLLVFTGIRDITWRKQAERQLRENEARFRAVAETATDAVIIADSNGTVAYFNHSAERMFGRSSDEVAGQPLTLLMPERYRTAHREGLQRYLATGKAHVIGKTVELTGLKSDGSELPIELSLATWLMNDAVYFTGLIRDVTERKQAELQIQELNQRLSLRNTELEVLNSELEAFSYSVSHDLRAPLRAIDGFSRILLDEHEAALDAAGRGYLERVRRATQNMGDLIDNLLRLSRVTRAELALEEVDITRLAHEVIDNLRQDDPDRSVQCEIATGIKATADPRLLRITMENLLGNAWKFTMRKEQARIEFGTQTNNTNVVYYVKDNGAGFDARYADKLFGPFQRLHDTTEFTGTGIGLATVKRIIQKHGGRIWAESEVEKGATFFFTLSHQHEEVNHG